jgi:hypothetical protein
MITTWQPENTYIHRHSNLANAFGIDEERYRCWRQLQTSSTIIRIFSEIKLRHQFFGVI